MKTYDVVIVGGGVSGTALLYTLAHYTNLTSVALVEKYPYVGSVNSHSSNNSQTLHVGDIETNYSLEKVQQVRPAAMMVAEFALQLPKEERDEVLFPTQKMVLGVGTSEVEELRKRFEELKSMFPDLALLDREAIGKLEPAIVEGRDPRQEIIALQNNGFAVDYGMLARSLSMRATSLHPTRAELFLSSAVTGVRRTANGEWEVSRTSGAPLYAKVVVFDADAYSLFFAKKLGYGKEFSLIPIAGTFYWSRPLLRGKVYTMQNHHLPFAAVHGDPDVRMPGRTRWGPTARFFPVLESRHPRTLFDYFAVSSLERPRTWRSFARILLKPVRLVFFLKNLLYTVPFLGRALFAKEVQKIVPSVTASDFTRAKGFGGMRLQRVNTTTDELLLGEGKIVGDHIIFNMTPSPGASVCLYNAMRDAKTVVEFFGGTFHFDEARMEKELYEAEPCPFTNPSQEDAYVS